MGLCHHMVVYSPAHGHTPIRWGIPVSAHMGCIPASVAVSAQSLLRIASLPWPLRPPPCLMTTAEVEDQAAKAIGLILLLAGAPNLHARDRMKQICVIVNMYHDVLHAVAIDDLTTGEWRSAAAVAPVDDAVMEPTEAEYVQALMSDRGAEAAAASHFTDRSSAIAHASRSGLGGIRHTGLKSLWVRREVEDGRVRVKKVAGLDNTTDVATKHVDAATRARCQVALGLVVLAGEFRGAEAAGEETRDESNALFLAMTLLAVAGAHALLERCGRIAHHLCGPGPQVGAVIARRHAASQTEPMAAVARDVTVSAAPSALFVARYGECVHGSRACRGISSVGHAVRELRPCGICMPRRG